MDLLKAKIYLDKINREFARMLKDPENVPRIDVDITMSYVRELYDAFLSEYPEAARGASSVKKVPHVEAPPPVMAAPAPYIAPAPPAPAPPPPPPVQAPPAPEAAPAPPPMEVAPAPPPPPVVVAPPPAAAAPQPEAPAPKPAVPVSTPVITSTAEVLFEYKEAKELSEKLSETPISDLKRAIALNDKLLLTRELFAGNSAAFDETLNALNSFSGFEQAKAYLINHCIGNYDWLDKKKAEAAKGFIRLIRRRYK
jgi:hypothetical protein